MYCKETTKLQSAVSVDFLAQVIFGHHVDRHDCSRLDFFALLAPAFPNVSRLSFASRLQQLRPWGEKLSETAAAAGFSLATAPSPSLLRLKCVSCGAEVDVHLPGNTPAFSHRLGCQFDRVRALCSPGRSSPASKRSLLTRRLLTHLWKEWSTTKVFVAREFGYQEDKICIALAKRFLETGKSFPNAGSLVEMLIDFCLANDSLNDILDGISHLVLQKTPSPDRAKTEDKAAISEIIDEKKIKAKGR